MGVFLGVEGVLLRLFLRLLLGHIIIRLYRLLRLLLRKRAILSPSPWRLLWLLLRLLLQLFLRLLLLTSRPLKLFPSSGKRKPRKTERAKRARGAEG